MDGKVLAVLLIVAILPLSSDATDTIAAYAGDSVALPCRVDISQCGDIHSVKWYRDTSRIYVFSQVGGIKRAEGDATERMAVEYEPSGTEALLKISPVKVEDEANYKCEITYLEVRENCDIVQIVKLETLVRPNAVRVLDSAGIPINDSSTLEPSNEGKEIELICEANGGRPIPDVKWYNGSEEMRGKYSSHDDGDGVGTGRSKLQVTLTRGDLLAVYECRVTSRALEQPMTVKVIPNVNVRPTKLELDIQRADDKPYVIQGNNVSLTCNVYGAKPAATVKWYNYTTALTNKNMISTTNQLDNEGSFITTNVLTIEASRWDNGQIFKCIAENSVIIETGESSPEAVLHLDVRYAPVVTVSPALITTNETGSILLLCNYVANPQQLEEVIWRKDDKPLTITDDKYDGGSVENPPLIIKNVSREDMGNYTCTCRNSIGASESDTKIFLNVIYPPEVEVVMYPSGPILASQCTNVTLECKVNSGNPSSLDQVTWYLDGNPLAEVSCQTAPYAESDRCNSTRQCEIEPSLILLERVQEKFSGNYSCQGLNSAGIGPASETRELIVYYPPSPAKLRYAPSRVIKKGSVTLECSIDHPGRPDNVTYLWYRGYRLVRETTTSNWTINSVSLETRNNFTCRAANEGGLSEDSTVTIDVLAPPAFIQNLAPYQGIIASSKNVSLTCRVECFPICSIVWYKDGVQLDVRNNPLYSVNTVIYPPDTQKNDFESVESTLVWNIKAWPGEQLDRTAPDANYSCQSVSNGIGPGVISSTKIVVDFPPENLTVSSRSVSVVEYKQPEPVKCSGKGRPTLSYAWRKHGSPEIIAKKEVLQLEPMSRAATGAYVCEASNRYGTASINFYLNVLYAPECTITMKEVEGNPALICTVNANPQEVDFRWYMQEENSNNTEDVSSLAREEGLNSFLELDTSANALRTYFCYANNSVGTNHVPCEISVPGSIPWWQRMERDTLIIIIATIVAILICVLIICCIIIFLCRRKRASNKSPNQSSTESKTPLGLGPQDGGSVNHNNLDPDNKGFYENLPFHGMQNPPNKPYKPEFNEFEYADVDYKSYGPINYKAASIYAAMKRGRNGKLQEKQNDDLL